MKHTLNNNELSYFHDLFTAVSGDQSSQQSDLQLLTAEVQSLRQMMFRTLSDMGHVMEAVKTTQTEVRELSHAVEDVKTTLAQQQTLLELLPEMENKGDQQRALNARHKKGMLESLANISASCQANTNAINGKKVALNESSVCNDSLDEAAERESQTTLCSSTSGPRDCADVQRNGNTESGIYTICVAISTPLQVYCDLETSGGGWTVLMRRSDADWDFPNRVWMEYRDGFGDLEASFWLGNHIMHNLTNARSAMLRVDLQDWEGEMRYAHYGSFNVGPEDSQYQLTVNEYSGNAGDDLIYHNNMKFTTRDVDNDTHDTRNLAQYWKGGWWYYSTGFHCKLTGEYIGTKEVTYGHGVHWGSWHRYRYSLRKAEMKIRPADFTS